MNFFRIISFIIAFLLADAAHAHELSNGYLSLESQDNQTFNGVLLLKPYELERQVGLDENSDGQLTWQETTASANAIAGYVKKSLLLSQGAASCSLSFKPLALQSISGQTLIGQPFSAQCDGSGPLVVNYSGGFNLDSAHKLLVSASVEGASSVSVISAQNSEISLSTTKSSTFTVFKDFVYEGIIHIWIGIDHILFLVVTLLTVNLIRERGKWKAEPSRGTIVKHTLYLVTAFTVAHSLTLTSTAIGWYSPSSRWVEIGIALSVLFTALNNLWPLIHRLGWITFAFGLLHGMGFASVFSELQANTDMPLLTIAAFNIGVEIGQLVIVAALLPALILLRHAKAYAAFIMPATSSVIALVAVTWAIQRW